MLPPAAAAPIHRLPPVAKQLQPHLSAAVGW